MCERWSKNNIITYWSIMVHNRHTNLSSLAWLDLNSLRNQSFAYYHCSILIHDLQNTRKPLSFSFMFVRAAALQTSNQRWLSITCQHVRKISLVRQKHFKSLPRITAYHLNNQYIIISNLLQPIKKFNFLLLKIPINQTHQPIVKLNNSRDVKNYHQTLDASINPIISICICIFCAELVILLCMSQLTLYLYFSPQMTLLPLTPLLISHYTTSF